MVYNPAAGYIEASGFVQKTQLGQITDITLDLRYVGSNTMPTGSFQILSGSPREVTLTSTAFEYMLVTGNTATVRGSGTWRDGTAVGFLVLGADLKANGASGDTIRMKVWRLPDGVVLYDTEPGVSESAAPATPVRAGSFTIRR